MMTLHPILAAPLAIQIHVVAALLAMGLGPIALYRRRRDRAHRVLGYSWSVAMAVTALSAFAIPAAVMPLIGSFGPIHFFGLWALWSLWVGICAARQRDLARHSATMRALYWQALGITGILTILPGRRLSVVFFGDREILAMIVIALALAALLLAPRFFRTAKI